MKFLPLIFFIVIIFSGCKKDDPNRSSNQNMKLAPNAILIDEPTAQILVSLDTTKIIFNGNTSQLLELKQNDIIISGIAPNAPYGYLRKILSIQKSSNQFTILTRDATLTEAFENLYIDHIKSFATSDTASGKKESLQFTLDFPNEVIYDADGNNNTLNDRVTLSGSVSFTPSISTQIDIQSSKLNHVKVAATIESDIQNTLIIGGNISNVSKEKIIFSKALTPFMLPGAPIVIVPFLRVSIGFDGSISASITSSYSTTSTISTHIEYQNNTWDKGSSYSMDNYYDFTGLSATATITGYLKPSIDFSFFGMRGATVNIITQGYLKLEASTTPQQCQLSAGINAGIEAQIKIFGTPLADISYPNILSYEKPLYQCSYDSSQNPSPPVADFTASNTVITVGQSVQFTNLSTNATTYQWNFASLDSCTPSYSFSTTPPPITYNYVGEYNVTLIAIDQQLGQSNTKTKQSYIKVNPASPISTGCGSVTSITDIDGNIYPTVTIGNQCWLKENLKTTKFSDGSIISNITDPTNWANATTSAWCWYDNSVNYEAPYGKLYNWFAATDSRKLCPVGWHVPTKADWEELINYVGGKSVAAGHLKEAGLSHWNTDSGSDNSSGFTALPAGGRSEYGGGYIYITGNQGLWWSSTPYSSTNAYQLDINTSYNYLTYPLLSRGKTAGLSVRCIKD